MALTPSTMLPLGTEIPIFKLPAVDGSVVSVQDYGNYRGLVVAFICNHCPYVKHINEELVRFAMDLEPQGIAVVAINSNDATRYPDDDFDAMKEVAARLGYPFAYLFDESQQVAKAFQAACTPDFYLFNEVRQLVYRGQFDDSRPGSNIPVTGESLRAACDALINDHGEPSDQKPSIGCNIKWRKGNEPGESGVQ